jgi:hypothetical protein
MKASGAKPAATTTEHMNENELKRSTQEVSFNSKSFNHDFPQVSEWLQPDPG